MKKVYIAHVREGEHCGLTAWSDLKSALNYKNDYELYSRYDINSIADLKLYISEIDIDDNTTEIFIAIRAEYKCSIENIRGTEVKFESIEYEHLCASWEEEQEIDNGSLDEQPLKINFFYDKQSAIDFINKLSNLRWTDIEGYKENLDSKSGLVILHCKIDVYDFDDFDDVQNWLPVE
jgi:hypothetical protein